MMRVLLVSATLALCSASAPTGVVTRVPWPSLGTVLYGVPVFSVHARIAWEVVCEPTVAQWLAQQGLDPIRIVLDASREPASFDHFSYQELSTGAYLSRMQKTEREIGKLLHSAGDGGVAINHAPANTWYQGSQLTEIHYELAGELRVWSWTWTPATTTLPQASAAFFAAMQATTQTFRTLPNSQQVFWNGQVQALAQQSMADATVWAHAVMRHYIRNAP